VTRYIIFFLGCDKVQPDKMLPTFQRNVLASSLLLSEEVGSKFIRNFFYSTVHGFWPVEVLAELADGPTGCGEVARGGCLFAWNFSVIRTAVLTEAGRRPRPNMLLH
jgi:hypothetical protein